MSSLDPGTCELVAVHCPLPSSTVSGQTVASVLLSVIASPVAKPSRTNAPPLPVHASRRMDAPLWKPITFTPGSPAPLALRTVPRTLIVAGATKCCSRLGPVVVVTNLAHGLLPAPQI